MHNNTNDQENKSIIKTNCEISPIAIFQCQKINTYDAARQGSVDDSSNPESWGMIVCNNELMSAQQWKDSLQDLDGISHLWLIYQFHKNENWHSKVSPPRGSDKKIGVFATRSPYRPNFLGLSCVRLMKIDFQKETTILYVANYDLLDQTPIFDIKPYLPYADSFPEAQMGWLENIEQQKFSINFSAKAQMQIDYLLQNSVPEIKNFILQQLSYEPFNKKKKRFSGEALAYRTWRIFFQQINTDQNLNDNQNNIEENKIEIQFITSGYSTEELLDLEFDKYQDKKIHCAFNLKFQS
jgi:tRNA-Thr(GGU) m(6)t(6)A37 methyltransferase TsaA